jgi:predicted amidohydrolase
VPVRRYRGAMPADRSLAAAQTIPVRGDLDANLETHLRLAEAAANRSARVLVFPELSLTGYELDLAGSLAFAEQDARLDPLRALAERLAMTIIAGAPVRLETGLHLGAFIVYPDGSLDLYTKQRMGAFPPDVNPGGPVPPPEASVFTPGSRNPLVSLGASSGAIAICADIGREGHASEAAARGAAVYLASMFVIPADFEQDRQRLVARARDHGMAVVFANYGGPSGGLPAAGQSGILSPSGTWLAQLGPAGAGIVIAREDPDGWQAEAIGLS